MTDISHLIFGNFIERMISHTLELNNEDVEENILFSIALKI